MLRFGKHPPKVDYRMLRFANYITETLAPPLPEIDLLTKIYYKLGGVNPNLFPMDGNDRLGDCTIAAMAHAITVFRGLLGTRKIPSESLVEKLYMHLTGGIDAGLNMLDVLSYWRQHYFSNDEILAYVSVNPHNHTHIKQAVQLFGGLYLGFQVQENCIAEFDAKKPWEAGRLTNDGHAVYMVGYNQNQMTLLTWGSSQQGTWSWWDECVDEVYAILPPEAKRPGFAPGFDFKALKADLALVAN